MVLNVFDYNQEVYFLNNNALCRGKVFGFTIIAKDDVFNDKTEKDIIITYNIKEENEDKYRLVKRVPSYCVFESKEKYIEHINNLDI